MTVTTNPEVSGIETATQAEVDLKAPIADPAFTGTITTAGQVAYPATQDPSADANTLDDYEEAPVAPTLTGATTTTYTNNAGKSTKVGREISFDFQLTINQVGDGNTASIDHNMPSSPTTVAINIGLYQSSATAVTNIAGFITGTTIQLYSSAAAAASLSINPIFQNGTNVLISGTYNV